MQVFKFKSSVVLLILVFIQAGVYTQNYISKSQINKAIKEFTKSPLLKSASISFAFIDLRSGKQIATIDGDRALIPASSQKIISCALILDKLSGDYKINTPFYLDGVNQMDGNFNGNLEIIGKGDPGFASESFSEIPKLQDITDTLSAIFKRKGISRINGQIKVDEQFIKDIPENKEWMWYDLGNYYGAGCFAFNYAENQASISLSAAKQNGEVCAIFRVQPNQLSSIYTSKVVGKEQPMNQDVYVLGNSQSCTQEILGEWKCCGVDTLMIRSALSKPSNVFVNLLDENLKRNGILIDKMNFLPSNSFELIYNYKSPALKDLVRRALTKSVNLYCESFVHLYGNAINGTTDRQSALIKMNQVVSDITGNQSDVVIVDGSGLSPKNMISSSAFVKFLEWIHKNDSLSYFWQLLPENSKQGPLSKWLKPVTKKKLELRLKSGSMERVRSYSGYIMHENQPVYAMSLLVNHYTCNGETMNELIAHFLNNILYSK